MEPELIEVFKSLNHSLELLNKSSDTGKYIVWAAAVGALAGLIPQEMLYRFRSIRKKNNRCLDLTSELHRLTELLRDHYRELAMHKAHKFYWWANYLAEEKKKDEGEDHEMEKFYSKHIESGNKVRITELKVADTFASYHKVITQIQMLSGFIKDVQESIKKYKSHEPTIPLDLDSRNQDLLPELERVEEGRLRSDYMKFISILEDINEVFTDKFGK